MDSKTATISVITCLAVLSTAANLLAATITKANNTDNLNLTTSWTNGVVPGVFDVARWDTNVTSANSVALGADISWSGIIVTNTGGQVTITAGNTLTLGTNGIDMSKATQGLTIGSGLTIGPGLQRWIVTNGTTLTISGTLTRSGFATLIDGGLGTALASQGTVTASPTLENGILPWVTAQSAGTAAPGLILGNTFGTVSSGNIVAYTDATLENTAGTGVVFGGIPTGDNSTVNYDLNVASIGGPLGSDLYVNSLRNVGGAYTNNGTANFRANAIMNAGTGFLTIGTPIQQADPALNELVLSAWTQGIQLNGPISDNVNPLEITFTGTNSQSVLLQGNSTFSGGVTINGVKVGIRTNSTPQTGTVVSGPLGKGTITMQNGAVLIASGANYAIANPIVIGPGGVSFQASGASPDLSINGPITGSGTMAMAGVFNQNGLFFNGDDSGFTGTVIVSGSNNRLGSSLSGSALAKWVINGSLSAQVVDGTNYLMGELSGSSAGGLGGHAGNLTPAVQNFIVGQLNTSSTYAGIIVNNALNNAQTGNSDAAANNVVALTKVGAGILTLTGANTATGPVTISGGGIQLGTGRTTGVLSPSATITNNSLMILNHNNTFAQGTNFSAAGITGSGSVVQFGTGTTIFNAANTYAGNTVVSNGTLLVNGFLASPTTVMPGAKLSGNGTIDGVVNVQAGGQLNAGDPVNIGTLTLNNTPVLSGTVVAKINAVTAQADQIVVTGGNPANYGGTLVVTNVGGPLLAGDSFTLFSALLHSGSFSSIVGNPGTGLVYSFTNGVLSVVSTIPPTPPDITATIGSDSNSNSVLTVAWPVDHTGWMLQSQTNDVDGGLNYSGTWYDLLGSTSVNMLSITNPLNRAMYFRTRYVSPPIPSNAPTILTARATNTAVVLTWSSVPLARSYNFKNSTVSGGPYTTVANIIGNSYTNSGLSNDIAYFFVVSAVNYNGETTNSSEVMRTPIRMVPLAPTGLTAQASYGIVQLNWTANLVGPLASSYNVKRSTTSGGPYTMLANVPATAYTDTNGLVDGTTYYYVVSGVNSDGEGLDSAETTASPHGIPTVPVGVTATGQYLQVRVNWAATFGATSYNVKYATVSGGPYTTYTNSVGTAAYIGGLTAGATYYIVVSAMNGGGETANSAETNATPTSVLPLSYDFENTLAGYPTPPMPPLGDPNLQYIQPLPDPYYYAADPLNVGGTANTNFSAWETHRSEIQAQIRNYEIGFRPTVDPSMIGATIAGSGTTRTLTVVVTNIVGGSNRTLTLSSLITLPSATGTFPIIIGMNSQNGSVNSSLLTQVAKLTFSHDQVTIYGSQQATDPYYKLYAAPFSPALDTFNTGQYSAWSWGCSRLIDGLYKLNGNLGGGATINLTRIAVTGCSYAGKMALFCGAQDERVTLTIAQESGGGGAPTWRYSATEPAGSVEWLPNTDHNWFSEDMFGFGVSTNVGFLPEDHHELIALCAPRAVFCTDNPDYVWLSNPSCYVSVNAALRIYTDFGIPDRIGWNIIGNHAHCSTTATIDGEMNAFIQKFLLNNTASNTIIRDVDPNITNTVNFARWTQWWGTTNAILP